MSARTRALEHWCATALGAQPETFAPASSDASFRRYFRLTRGRRSWIAMDAPPPREDVGPFLEVLGRLRAAGVHAPAVHAEDRDRGFLLLEDLGSRAFLDALDADSADALYADALDALLTLQRDVPTTGLPVYDRAKLVAEMQLFPEWYLGRHRGLVPTPAQRAALAAVFDRLAERALEQERAFVHRDYHSRNLMVCEAENPGVIDFQDAVHGPLTYDLVSLLRDCYVAWPGERVDAWALSHHARLVDAGLTRVDGERFLEDFDLMGVQRHLKAIGIFARLAHRDGKPGYLADIPRTLGHLYTAIARRPALAPLGELLDDWGLDGVARGKGAP